MKDYNNTVYYARAVTAQLYYRNITPILNKEFITKVIEPGTRSNVKLACAHLYEMASQIVNYALGKPYTLLGVESDTLTARAIPMNTLNRIATDLVICGYAVMGVDHNGIIRVPPEAVDVRDNEWKGYDFFKWFDYMYPQDCYPKDLINVKPDDKYNFPKPDFYTVLRLHKPSLIERVRYFIDAHEILYSRKHDALTDSPNTPLIIKGYLDNPDEIVNRTREDGVLCVSSEGSVESLSVNVDYSQQDAQLDRLIFSMYRAAECVPPLHNAGADTSSVTLKMMHSALDSAARELEPILTSALYECLAHAQITGLSSNDLGKIRIAFNYSGVINENDDVQNVALLKDVLSRQALIEHIPWIQNVGEELKRKPCSLMNKDLTIDDAHQENNQYDKRKMLLNSI